MNELDEILFYEIRKTIDHISTIKKIANREVRYQSMIEPLCMAVRELG